MQDLQKRISELELMNLRLMGLVRYSVGLATMARNDLNTAYLLPFSFLEAK